MTDLEFARYIGRMNDAPTPASLMAIARELASLPESHERDTLQRTIRTMIARRAVEN